MTTFEIGWAGWCGFLLLTTVVLMALYARDQMDVRRERRTAERQAMLNIPMEDDGEHA